ncbi:hypothetical protein DDQ41_03720 [Streptomyces spongiicola]|uniref:Uncharacterized protein n=1 Tax=Streptomyces spongiicola TaxID=1690221 RepID=A0ABM6V3I7_9ACTN|nr:hypothetical protein [Streptomyces spongiicola]AWK08190.1 hypothetical protein DDQ41_03720 [Streptomyces spongiicola]
MPKERWRLDLREDITNAIDGVTGGTCPANIIDAVLLSVLPHLEGAYKRGLMAGRSQAGYRARRNPEEKS